MNQLLLDMIISNLENECLTIPSNMDFVCLDNDGDVYAYEGSVHSDGDEWINDVGLDLHYIGTISGFNCSKVWGECLFTADQWREAISK